MQTGNFVQKWPEIPEKNLYHFEKNVYGETCKFCESILHILVQSDYCSKFYVCFGDGMRKYFACKHSLMYSSTYSIHIY